MENLIAAIFGSVVTGICIFAGNCYIHRKNNHLNRIETLKNRLYNLAEMGCEYWSVNREQNQRLLLETKLLSAIRVCDIDYTDFANKDKLIKKSLDRSKGARLLLRKTITGGCFQQKVTWNKDPARGIYTTTAISGIVKTLD